MPLTRAEVRKRFRRVWPQVMEVVDKKVMPRLASDVAWNLVSDYIDNMNGGEALAVVGVYSVEEIALLVSNLWSRAESDRIINTRIGNKNDRKRAEKKLKRQLNGPDAKEIEKQLRSQLVYDPKTRTYFLSAGKADVAQQRDIYLSKVPELLPMIIDQLDKDDEIEEIRKQEGMTWLTLDRNGKVELSATGPAVDRFRKWITQNWIYFPLVGRSTKELQEEYMENLSFSKGMSTGLREQFLTFGRKIGGSESLSDDEIVDILCEAARARNVAIDVELDLRAAREDAERVPVELAEKAGREGKMPFFDELKKAMERKNVFPDPALLKSDTSAADAPALTEEKLMEAMEQVRKKEVPVDNTIEGYRDPYQRWKQREDQLAAAQDQQQKLNELYNQRLQQYQQTLYPQFPAGGPGGYSQWPYPPQPQNIGIVPDGGELPSPGENPWRDGRRTIVGVRRAMPAGKPAEPAEPAKPAAPATPDTSIIIGGERKFED